MKGPEQRYSSSEKNYLALVYISQRYRHYFQAHQVEVVSKNEGLRSLIEKPTLTGRIGCWALLLCKYDVKLVTSTTIKNQALADLLLISPKKVTIKKLSGQIPGTIEIVHACNEEKTWTFIFNEKRKEKKKQNNYIEPLAEKRALGCIEDSRGGIFFGQK
ncbi:hypothetical protein Ahy_A06g028758 [Arachis hypogaea]|uniref:Reverse transcriptase RNase H-like domain-containing protein n=1 Tax=Arachis hypogaea TaxID=3818 RepID=A0A445CRJ7_ARAHY|nr:hypothetical protein Ahy_A06g028758 [Arachis hypogaea]